MTKLLTIFISLFLLSFHLSAQNIIEEEMHCNSKKNEALVAYSLGTEAFKNEDYKTAVGYLDKAIKLDSTFCDAWNNLGVACRYAGNWKNGYWALIRAIMLDTTYYVSWLNLSEHFMWANDTTNAIKSIKNLLRSSPNDYQGIFALGKLYYWLAEFDSSMKYIDLSLTMKQNNEAKFIRAYNFFEQKKFNDFKNLADILYPIDEKDGHLNYYLGKYYANENDIKRSKKYLKTAKKNGFKMNK
jgi:Tfp pilus assembly protein PilF